MTIQHLYPTTRPTLDLNFARQKRLDPRVTFTRGSTATYVGSDGLIKTAASNEARFDHDPATGESLGLLMEESRTNLLTYNEEFDNAAWTKSNITVTANTTAAPSGSINADKLVASAINSLHYVFKVLPVTAGTHTLSLYAKSSGLDWVALNIYDGSGYRKFSFNVSTGEKGIVASGLSSTITPASNGWYRITATYTSTGTGNNTMHFHLFGGESTEVFLGDGVSGAYFWGAQLEAGSFPTSYIPTSGSTVTRSADVASMTGTNFSSWYNQSEGSFFLDERNSYGSFLNLRFELNQDSSPNSNAIAFNVNYANGTRISSRDSNTTGSIDRTLPNVWTQGGSHKYAYGLEENNFSVVSGTNSSTDTSGTFPPNLDSLSLGANARSATLSNNCGKVSIARLTYYPTRLTDAQLQALTL